MGWVRRSAINASRCSVDTSLAAAAASRTVERRVDLQCLHRGANVRLERGAFLRGNAEHLADDGHRQRQRELGNDVDDRRRGRSGRAARRSGARCRGRSFSTVFGVKAFATSRRRRVWSGGSSPSIDVVRRCEVGEAFVPLRFGQAVALPDRPARHPCRTADRAAPTGSRRSDRRRRNPTRSETPAPARGSRRNAGTDPPCPRA